MGVGDACPPNSCRSIFPRLQVRQSSFAGNRAEGLDATASAAGCAGRNPSVAMPPEVEATLQPQAQHTGELPALSTAAALLSPRRAEAQGKPERPSQVPSPQLQHLPGASTAIGTAAIIDTSSAFPWASLDAAFAVGSSSSPSSSHPAVAATPCQEPAGLHEGSSECCRILF